MPMPAQRPNPSWFRYVAFWRSDPRGELEQELSFNLEARVDEYIASGLDPAAARARAVARLRAFAAAAIACLVLGIGVNTAIFSVVDAVLFRPLPFRDPGRLVMVGEGL